MRRKNVIDWLSIWPYRGGNYKRNRKLSAWTLSVKMRAVAIVVVALAVALVAGQERVLPRLIDQFPLGHPAFVQLFATERDVDPLDKYTLYISNFDALAVLQRDDIYLLRSPGRQLNDVANWAPTLIDKENFWPNDVNFMPSSVVGREGVVWTSGFLVPGKQSGALNIYFTDVDPVERAGNIASLDELAFSYHRVVWYDVNKDGLLDAVTARFNLPTLGAPTYDLLWLENPGNGVYEGWTQHLITSGPDVHFRLSTFQVAGQDFTVLIVGEFFTERLVLYYAADGSDSFLSDPSTIISLVIDDVNVGQIFDLEVSDLNLDGRPELTVCGYNHTLGSVFVFPVPDDFRSDPWERIVIADNFKANLIIGGQSMTPGAPHAFYKGLQHEQSGEKPYVFVSGDDDGKHYILEPVSQDPADWTYNKHLLVDTNATTTGKYAIADLDNDGYNEIVAAGFTANEVYVYTYAP
ncbi:Hypothetical predicted protein [Cloeon dipterum]|uniref:VCBS repeat-containing protein n=1 Tax=Cloeon dipterum TaxID=197152 RepID=A0A8S1DMN3_9INSE|nr:Hypothetical predicted protein [Cloeon dipterum]